MLKNLDWSIFHNYNHYTRFFPCWSSVTRQPSFTSSSFLQLLLLRDKRGVSSDDGLPFKHLHSLQQNFKHNTSPFLKGRIPCFLLGRLCWRRYLKKTSAPTKTNCKKTNVYGGNKKRHENQSAVPLLAAWGSKKLIIKMGWKKEKEIQTIKWNTVIFLFL